MSDSEKMAKAASMLHDDSEIGGLVQLLAMALHSKGLSAADIDGVCSRERRWGELKKGDAGWAGWLEGWMTETGCWLRQPGVWDGVSAVRARDIAKSYEFERKSPHPDQCSVGRFLSCMQRRIVCIHDQLL